MKLPKAVLWRDMHSMRNNIFVRVIYNRINKKHGN